MEVVESPLERRKYIGLKPRYFQKYVCDDIGIVYNCNLVRMDCSDDEKKLGIATKNN